MRREKKRRKTEDKFPFPKYQNNDSLQKYVFGDSSMGKCVDLIKNIISKEGYKGKNPFSKQQAINLDKYEFLTCAGKRDNTVDFVFCCEKGTLVLCEAKFRIDGVGNFVKTLNKKIKHSKDILLSNVNIVSCYHVTLVLLPDKNFYQNERMFNNLFSNNLYKLRVITVGDFYENFFL